MANKVAHRTYAIPRKPVRAELLEALACWDEGGAVTGPYTMDLFRYRQRLEPLVSSQDSVNRFEYIRRTLEDTNAC